MANFSRKVIKIIVILGLGCVESIAQERGGFLEQAELPIDASLANGFTKFRTILFPEEDFEISILQTSPNTSGVYIGAIIVKTTAGYECRLKRLDISEAVSNGTVDPEKINSLKPNIITRQIDKSIVSILTSTLKRQVIQANYLAPPRQPVPDDVNHEAYATSLGVVYCCKVVSAYPDNISSCGNILGALEIYVKENSKEALKKIVTFIKNNPGKIGLPQEPDAQELDPVDIVPPPPID